MYKRQCERSASDAPVEYADKEQIQRNIDHGRQDQVIKRMPAVSDGLEDADQYVVEDKCQRTGEINPEIEDRVRHDVCGSSHPDKLSLIHI